MTETQAPYATRSETRPLEGYFYRRKNGRHLNAETGPADAEIYYCFMAFGRRYASCMHTTSLEVARRRARIFPRGIALDSRETFLHGLVRLGETARKELDAAIDRPKRRPRRGRA